MTVYDMHVSYLLLYVLYKIQAEILKVADVFAWTSSYKFWVLFLFTYIVALQSEAKRVQFVYKSVRV